MDANIHGRIKIIMTGEKNFSSFMIFLEDEENLNYFLDSYKNYISAKSQAEENRRNIEEEERRHTAINMYGLEFDFREINYSNGIHPYDTFEKFMASEKESLQEIEEKVSDLESQVWDIWDAYCRSHYHTDSNEKFEVETERVFRLFNTEQPADSSEEPTSAFYDYVKRTGSWKEVRILISEINHLQYVLSSLEELQENINAPDALDSWMNERYEDGTPYYNSFEEYSADIQNHIFVMKKGIEQKRQSLSSKFWAPFMAEIASLSFDEECEKLKDFIYQ